MTGPELTVLVRAHRRRVEEQVDVEALGAWLSANWGRAKRLQSFKRAWRHSSGGTSQTAAEQRADLKRLSTRLPKGYRPVSS